MSEAEKGLDALVARLAAAGWKEREPIKQELIALGQAGDPAWTIGKLEELKKDLILEVRWELDEVIEVLTPAPEVPEEPEEDEAAAPADPKGPVNPADLNLVYDDPRGFTLHKHKTLERWFATQNDPRTNQPQTFELHPQEIEQLKKQLTGSPYWVLGSGGA